jgi:NTE family protein
MHMSKRALVLGGGGVTGIAWELGLLAGLAEAGVDLSTADLVVGTSAGSVVGAEVAGGLLLEKLYADQLVERSDEIAARMGARIMLAYLWAFARSADQPGAGRRIGRLALAARTVPEAERRAVIESRLPVRDWPERRLLITAVDAGSGELTAFERDSGVSLVDAVGASCAVPGVWPPVTIGGRRWIDGGVRSSTNADLAAGCEQVVILAPVTVGIRAMPSVARQAAGLVTGGSRVAVVSPDKAARQAIGRNVLDPARRAGAARAGRTQASSVAGTVADVWD